MREVAANNSITQSTRSVAYRLVGLQALVVVVIALGWLFGGLLEAGSALLGGAACVIPSAYFANRFFASAGSSSGQKIIMAFYLNEMVKLLLSAVLVVLIVLFIQVSILPFIVGFVGAQFGLWLAPLTIKRRTAGSEST